MLTRVNLLSPSIFHSCLPFMLFQVYNLKDPFESNCTEQPINDLGGYTKFTTSACMLRCRAKYLIEHCGCRDVKLPRKYLMFTESSAKY